MGDHINTYTFTKALAEHVVNDARKNFRTCIIRPSMSKYTINYLNIKLTIKINTFLSLLSL